MLANTHLQMGPVSEHQIPVYGVEEGKAVALFWVQ